MTGRTWVAFSAGAPITGSAIAPASFAKSRSAMLDWN